MFSSNYNSKTYESFQVFHNIFTSLKLFNNTTRTVMKYDVLNIDRLHWEYNVLPICGTCHED